MKIECSIIVKFIVRNTVCTIQYCSDNYEICCEKNCVNSLFTFISLETCQNDNTFSLMWGPLNFVFIEKRRKCAMYLYRTLDCFLLRVWLMCVLRSHIKSSIFGNIFSGIEKTVNTFSILEKKISKNENYCVPLGHTLTKSFF